MPTMRTALLSLLVAVPALARADASDTTDPRATPESGEVSQPRAEPPGGAEPAPPAPPPAPPAPRAAGVRAVHVAKGPSVDGRLDDAAWAQAPVFDGFVLNEPTEGGPGSERTELRVVFDDKTLYVGFKNFDSQPEKIVGRIARRDSEPSSDYVAVMLSPSGDRRSARRFYLNAGGVQADTLHFDDVESNQEWDAVWRGRAARWGGGWSAELAIPLYVVGSFDAARPSWGFLARRYIARTHEKVGTVLIPRADNAFVSRFGVLEGTDAIAPRRAIELMPYVAFRSLVRPDTPDPFDPSREALAAGDIGLDAAFVLRHGLTLNTTLNPDFGQVEADDIVINVSTFETFFPEKRPFFTHGLDLFQPVGGDSGKQNLFYSRRIGRGAPILTAAKLTGAPIPGFSFGLLDALVTPERPLHLDSREESHAGQQTTNYLAAVTRASVGGDSWVGARFSAATPIGDECTAEDLALDPRPRRCTPFGGNALALDTTLRSADGQWALLGQLAASQVVGGPPSRLLRDGTLLERGDLGAGGYLRAGKLGGEPWRFEGGYEVETADLDLNATGFQRDSNRHFVYGAVGWTRPSGLGPLLSFDTTLRSEHSWSADGRGLTRAHTLGLQTNATLPGFHVLRWNLFTALENYDLREMNGSGVALEMPHIEYTRLTFESDPSQLISTTSFAALGHYHPAGPSPARYDWTLSTGIVVRPSDAWETRLDVVGDRTLFSPRYVDRLGEDRFLLGRLDFLTFTATLRQQWAITRDLTLQGYLQYVSAFGVYGPFYEASGTRADPITPGDLMPVGAPMISPDFHTAQVAVNLIARWEYSPGSTIYLVYQRSQSERPPDVVTKDIGSRSLFDGPAVDVISVKWTWFWSGS